VDGLTIADLDKINKLLGGTCDDVLAPHAPARTLR
jgi:hypothetical protein